MTNLTQPSIDERMIVSDIFEPDRRLQRTGFLAIPVKFDARYIYETAATTVRPLVPSAGEIFAFAGQHMEPDAPGAVDPVISS